ncbi:MAG: aa3-type cytochrome c oxidase subunit IV [Elioraea sp.]|nr:aa3-type cytochrome c oxidase subunit IV [Elioraea sp.]MDW8445409.1 aa3-type cytochrome c oxidase subunit IV [Acetobacteraceae bacterium]
MAGTVGATRMDDPKLDEFLRTREEMYRGFNRAVVWTVGSVAALLVLLALFLL